MLEHKKKVVIIKKTTKKREVISLTPTDLKEIKRWILTGSFDKEFYSDLNKIDLSKIHLIRKAAFTNVEELTKIVLDNSQIVTKPETLLLSLVFLSMGNFHAKKIFRTAFQKIVKSPNDLYLFLSLVRKYRGMGSIIHLVIKQWFISHDVHFLERAFVGEGAKYGWSGQDIIRIIKPKPRNKIESLIFKWLAKGEIGFNDKIDYENNLPLICLYEKLRNNSFNKPVTDLIDEFNFDPSAIPGNVIRSKDVLYKVLDSKTDDEFFRYIKSRIFLQGMEDYLSTRLVDILKEKRTLKIDVIELLSLLNTLISASVNMNTVMVLQDIIREKIKSLSGTKDDVVHLIDMSNNMFCSIDPFLLISPAVIASNASASSNNVFSFNGVRRSKDIRAIMEAEGGLETENHIKAAKLNFVPNAIFIWTNRKYLHDIERSVSKLKAENITTNVCLISLSESKLSNSNNRFFTIHGYNSRTKKIMRLVERGIL